MCCLFVFFNDITRLLPKYYNSAGAPRLDILTVSMSWLQVDLVLVHCGPTKWCYYLCWFCLFVVISDGVSRFGLCLETYFCDPRSQAYCLETLNTETIWLSKTTV